MGMLVLETGAKIRREHFGRGKGVKTIARELGLSRNTVRKVLRSGETSFEYERSEQPHPKLGAFIGRLEAMLESNAASAKKDRLTLTRIADLLSREGYDGVDAHGRLADSDLRTRIVSNEMDGRAFQQTAMRAMAEAKGNAGPSAATSIMKNAGTRWTQERAELTLEIMGHQGLGWAGEDFTTAELDAVRGWLRGKASTLYGGSQEVQNNIISKRILELPDLSAAH